MNRLLLCAALGAITTSALAVAPAGAQTAADINRLNAAIQICNSPMGAGMAECARLRGRLGLGGGPGLGGPVGLGGGKAAAAAGIFGLLNQARTPAAAPPAAAPAVDPAAIQQAIALCVQNANGSEAAIQACLRIADAKAPQPAFGALR